MDKTVSTVLVDVDVSFQSSESSETLSHWTLTIIPCLFSLQTVHRRHRTIMKVPREGTIKGITPTIVIITVDGIGVEVQEGIRTTIAEDPNRTTMTVMTTTMDSMMTTTTIQGNHGLTRSLTRLSWFEVCRIWLSRLMWVLSLKFLSQFIATNSILNPDNFKVNGITTCTKGHSFNEEQGYR